MDIVLASTNRGKVREYREWLDPLGFDVYSLSDYPSIPEIEETGDTFEENARIKALSTSQALKHSLILSDDSGLIVPSIGFKPGVYSARFAGENSTDLDNRKKLLEELAGRGPSERAAYFECVICLAEGGNVLKVATGRCEGFIAESERGNNGFGYDPLFIKHGYGKTFAELGGSVKAEVSHRRRAWDKIRDFLVHIARK